MSYTVLARKYRSQTFDDVVGQDAAAKTLKNAIESGRVAHAYLLSGTRGVGKTTMARILAKALNCLKSKGPTVKPCCKCDSCLAINTGDDIDVLEIDGASNNGVDQVRELRDNAIYRPARSRFKIYIIDEVHMLTVAAFNALLKILEEPPEHVKFIFATTEPNKVLPTIQSRCQRFDFRNISTPDIAKQLKTVLKSEKIKFEDDLILSVAKMANGSMRDGLSLLDRLISVGIEPLSVDLLEEYLGVPNVERIHALIEAMGDSDAAAALTQVDQLITSGLSEAQIVDALIDGMRDLMVLQSAGADSNLVVLTEDQRKQAQQIASKFDPAAFIYNITALEKLRWTLKNSDTPRTLLEASVLRFALSEHFLGVEQLLARAQAAGSDVKKKQPTARPPQAVTPPPARSAPVASTPTTTPEQTTPPAPTVSGSFTGDLTQIQGQWESIIAALAEKTSQATSSLVHRARPASLDNGTLTLEFDAKAGFQKQMCEANGRPDQIQQALSEILGGQVRIVFTLGDTEAAEIQPTQEKTVRPSERRSEVLNDPAVRAVLLGLNATVTGIEDNEP